MRNRSSAISRFAGALTIGWLCGIGSAWAGDGGDDQGFFQQALDTVCNNYGLTCLQLPTLTQIILGIADFQNTPPDFVRGPQGNVISCSVSGNNGLGVCSATSAVTTVNPLAPSSIALSDLPNLTPLGFQAGGQAAIPVPLGSGNSFVYPVLSGPDGQHTLNVVFDYTPWTSKSLVKGQVVGSFTFPLVMLNADSSETPIVGTLNLTATCTTTIQSQQQGQQGQQQSCLAGTVTVTGIGTGTKSFSAAQLGIQFGLQLAPSPNSSTPHLISTFQLPVIVTEATDGVYFGENTTVSTPSFTFINQLSGQATAFSKNDLGFTPKSLGVPIGVAPYPAPLCTATTCPSPPPTTPPTTFFGVCATIGNTPAAATFMSFGTDGTTYASSPVSGTPSQCP
jgi:hypothetical protein